MSERKTLEEFRDQRSISRRWSSYSEAVQGEEWEKLQYIKYEALVSFHDQEMKAKDAEIESLKQQITPNGY